MDVSIRNSTGYYITRDVKTTDPVFDDIDTQPQTIKDYYLNNNIYLGAFFPNEKYDITLSYINNSSSRRIHNLLTYSEEELESLAVKMMNTSPPELVPDGMQFKSYKKYGHSQTVMLKFTGTSTVDGNTYPVIQIFSIVNGNIVYYTLRCYQGNITEAMELNLNQFADGTFYTEIMPKPVIPWTIAALVAAGIMIVGALAAICFYLWKKHRPVASDTESDTNDSEHQQDLTRL